jgi:phosphoserine aminotransferase
VVRVCGAFDRGGEPEIIDTDFAELAADEQQTAIKTMLAKLEQENVALDIGNYRSAPTGFRIWGGATVDSSDLRALTPWLDHVFAEFKQSLQEN